MQDFHILRRQYSHTWMTEQTLPLQRYSDTPSPQEGLETLKPVFIVAKPYN